MANRRCAKCGKAEGDEGVHLKGCSQCVLIDYCGRECQTKDWKNHKVLCSKVPKAAKKAEEKIHNFRLSDYTLRNIGTFMVTEAQAQRGQIMEEEKAQDICYDAMEMTKGTTAKLLTILEALKIFPISTEGWGMLGHYYHYEVAHTREYYCCLEALKMYNNAIACARLLNPTWTEDRTEELPWGEIENRPYLRALHGKALCLGNTGQREEAIRQAKKMIRWNPRDNQGVRHSLCTWYLEAKDTEGCTNLLRKYSNHCFDTALAFTDVLLQYQRWQKDDAAENDVRKALYVAIKENPFVPDLIIGVVEEVGDVRGDDDFSGSYSPGSIKEAKYYFNGGFNKGAKKLWNKYPDAINWMRDLRFGSNTSKVPKEAGVINLLRSGIKFRMKCTHTDLNGRDPQRSTVIGTQRRKKCRGCRLDTFFWPRQLNQTHQSASDILVHNNDNNADRDRDSSSWRKTKYADIQEVPFWRVLLQFYEEDEDITGDYRDEPEPFSFEQESFSFEQKSKKQSAKYQKSDNLKCNKCNAQARFCALDERTEFYCSKKCMKNYLQETDPLYFDLDSEILKIIASDDCSIRTLDLDYALQVAADHMPNLKAVDIYINQEYILQEDPNNLGKCLLLAPTVLRMFLERIHVRAQLISFSFALDDCCWGAMNDMTDRCRALFPLGTMPNLKKLTLSCFGFDDIDSLVSCLCPGLEYLDLNHVKMGPTLEWSESDVGALLGKLSQLNRLVSLSLADIALGDHHLWSLLPNLKHIRCLNLDGRFGDGGESLLTDRGLNAIADNCPELLSLSVDYQGKATINGIMAVLTKCPKIVELSAMMVEIGLQQLRDVLTASESLLLFGFGTFSSISNQQQRSVVQNAVAATNGRVVICTMEGLFKVSLSPEHQRKQDDSKAKIDRSFVQQADPTVSNKWNGIL